MKKKSDISLKMLKAEVKKLDPNLSEDENYFKTALILLSLAIVGPTTSKIVKYTKLPTKYVAERISNLEASHVIKNGKVFCNWFDKEEGGVAFWCDVCVAEGLMKRA